MGNVSSNPKPVTLDVIKSASVLALNSYGRRPTCGQDGPSGPIHDVPGYRYLKTAMAQENRVDLYAWGSHTLVLVFPGSETFGHWVHNIAVGTGLAQGKVVRGGCCMLL